MATIFDRLARSLDIEEAGGGLPPEGGEAQAPRRPGWLRRNWRLVLIVAALLSLPLAYAVVISNVLQLTPPGGTEVVAPPAAPAVQLAMSPQPPIFGDNITAGYWVNTTLTVQNPQARQMYLKIRFDFNATPGSDWVTVLLDGSGPSSTVVTGNSVVMTQFLGNPTYTSFPLKFRIKPGLSGVKILDAKVWIDDSGASLSP
jgi:hypothetical protein